MNKLQLELSVRGKKVNMNLSTENESTIELAVLQSFAFMGVADPFATSPSLPMIEAETPVIEEATKEEVKEKEVDEIKVVEEKPKTIEAVVEEKKEPVVASRPRAVALITDSDNVLAYSTQEEEEKPRVYTGTKLFNGVTKYQTRYECPTCGNRGKRYLALDEHIAVCHECNQGMKKESVGKNGKLAQDDFGNFFIAKHGIL